MLFCICSDSGMTGTDIRVGSYTEPLNQQTLIKRHQKEILMLLQIKKVKGKRNGKIIFSLWCHGHSKTANLLMVHYNFLERGKTAGYF